MHLFRRYISGVENYERGTPEQLRNVECGVYRNSEPLTVYKKVKCKCIAPWGEEVFGSDWFETETDCIVTMEIPENSDIVVARQKDGKFKSNRPYFRTARVLVKDISPPLTYINCIVAEEHSIFDPDFEYRTGTVVTPDHLDKNYDDVSTHGIHFLLTKEEADQFVM